MAYGYEITQEDVDATVRFLKIAHPEHATPEIARICLEFNQDIIHDIAEADPELAAKAAEVMKQQSLKRAEKWAQRDRQ